MPILRPTYNRRAVIAGMGSFSLVSNKLTLADTSELRTQKKMVLIILRGAMDGLGAVTRPEDEFFRKYRPDLMTEESLALRQGFALHPALKGMHELFTQGEASVLHAVSGPNRERSHFLAQDLLETGHADRVTFDGWLNRAIETAPMPLSAIYIGSSLPLILRGVADTTTWSPSVLPEVPDSLMTQLQDIYSRDELLGSALAQALDIDEIAGNLMSGKSAKVNKMTNFRAAAKLLSALDGPNIAVLSLGGWDTHISQVRQLNNRLRELDRGVEILRTNLNEGWNNTMVVVVTEFGRTVRQNGTRGTDHGTGGAAFLLGGAVKGGRILGDWPGLKESQLYENRDLFPANDLRSLFKGVLTAQFGLSQSDLSNYVFPGSQGVPIIV